MIPSVIIEPQPYAISLSPYWRNDRILQKEFGTPILKDYNEFAYEKIRNLIITYWASWAHYKQISDFLKHHKEAQIYRMLNEYQVTSLSSDVKKAVDETKVITISSFDYKTRNQLRNISLNLNTLIFEEGAIKPPDLSMKKYDLIYYGMFRPNRSIYFKRYLSGDPEAYISTTPKNVLYFKTLGCRPHFMDSFYWGKSSQIERFRFSLYIEDIYSHSHYTYPANRFYEALMFNTIVLIDINVRHTLEKAGYQADDYYVDSAESLKAKMEEIKKDYPHHLQIQAGWRKRAAEERREVIDALRPIFI